MTFANILSGLLGLSAVCYVLLGATVTGSIRNTGGLSLGLTFALVGIWVLGGAVELVSGAYPVITAAHMVYFIAAAFVPVTLLICLRQYTGHATSRTAIFALLIVPVCSVVVAATNEWHALLWQWSAIEVGAAVARPETWGPWFLFVHAPYTYSILVLSVMQLLLHSTAVAPANRRRLVLLSGSIAVPIIASVAYDFGYGPEMISLVALVFAVMLPIYAWLIIRERINRYSPLAYETVFQNMQDSVIVIDENQKIIGMNHGAEKLLNISEQDALRKSLESVFGEGVPEVYEALESGNPQKMLTGTGRFLHVQVTPISTNMATSSKGRVVMFRDVSDVEKAQQEVLRSERLLRTLVNHSVNGIIRLNWVEDDSGNRVLRCIFANSAAGKFLNVAAQDLVSCTGTELITRVSTGMDTLESGYLLRKFEDVTINGKVLDTEACVEFAGSKRWLRLMAEPVGDDIAVTLIESTDRKVEELRMETIASSDPLTGVLNRRGFEREAAKRLMDSPDDATGALLFVDLNDFKQINDDHGHEVGDQLLTIAAQRLISGLRSCDIIGRPGGDEFVALIPDVGSDVAEKIAQRLTDSLEQNYLIDTKSLQCAASIGLALYPKNANTLTSLMRAADQAMYRAKARSRGDVASTHQQLLEKAI